MGLRSTTDYDEQMNITLSWANGPSSNKTNGGVSNLYTETMNASEVKLNFGPHAGGTGVDTDQQGGWKQVDAMQALGQWLRVRFKATSTAPTAGAYELTINRW